MKTRFLIAALGTMLFCQTSVVAQIAGFSADQIYRSCGSSTFAVAGNCIEAEDLELACDNLNGEARWTSSAFYCRAPDQLQQESTQQNTEGNTFGSNRRRRPFADFQQNNETASQNYSNRICGNTALTTGGNRIQGEICRFSADSSSSPVIGFFEFEIRGESPSTADAACVSSRVSAIVEATITHYHGKRINAARYYRFCNVSGRFSIISNF